MGYKQELFENLTERKFADFRFSFLFISLRDTNRIEYLLRYSAGTERTNCGFPPVPRFLFNLFLRDTNNLPERNGTKKLRISPFLDSFSISFLGIRIICRNGTERKNCGFPRS